MKRLFLISFYCLSLAWVTVAWTPPIAPASAKPTPVHHYSIGEQAAILYDQMCLENSGLSRKAFEYAFRGYSKLAAKNKLEQPGILTICDFSQSSNNKRLYILDFNNNTLLLNTYVAHGRNSGGEFATRFSNRAESLQSSLGFYVTKDTYMGEHGLSLKIIGMESGFNDKALRRGIVIHGASYVEESWLESAKYMGRSYGCPAVPSTERDYIINTIKKGTCLFIYHPSKTYLKGSKLLKD